MFDALITPKDLSPGLFENKSPDLGSTSTIRALSERPLLVRLIVGKQVINDNCFLFAVDVDGNGKDPRHIPLFSQEDLLNAAGHLSDG